MINNGNDYFAWYDCGKTLFSKISMRDKNAWTITRMTCKVSQVRVLQVAPFQPHDILKQYVESGVPLLWSLVAIGSRKSPSFITEIVVLLWYSRFRVNLGLFLRNGLGSRLGREFSLLNPTIGRISIQLEHNKQDIRSSS